MNTKIYCPDIECDSCIRVLEKRFSNVQGVSNFSIKQEYLDIEYDESLVKVDQLLAVVENAGFRASTSPFERKSLKERIRHIKENKHKYLTELMSLKYALWTFIILVGLEAIAYFGLFRTIPNFLGNYWMWILYSDLTIASVGGAMWHFYSYKTKVTCMLGMMIGMTIGMQSGMMIGAVLGATNGFFMGSLIGMLSAVFVGALTGRCCGVMGIMEGMMAGVMGGTMGPMISVMMLSDNIQIFMPFYFIINIFITWGLVYLVYEEAIEDKTVKRNRIDFSTFASFCIIVAAVVIWIMVYGPKSALIGIF